MEENFCPAWMDQVIRLNALKGDDDKFMAYIPANDHGERRYAYAPASISGYAVELNCALSPFAQPTSAEDLWEGRYTYAPASISGYAVELNCALSPFSQPIVSSRSTCALESLHFWEPVVSAEEDVPLVAKDEASGNAEPCSHPAQDAESLSNLLRDAEALFSMAQTSETIELIGRLLQQSFIGDEEDLVYEYCKNVLGEKYFYAPSSDVSGFVIDCSSPCGPCINRLDTWGLVVTADSDTMQFLSDLEKEEEGQDHVVLKEDKVMFSASDPIDESATSVHEECDEKNNVTTLLCAGPDSSITAQEEGDFVQGLDPAGLDCSNVEITASKPKKERKNSGCFSWLFRLFRRKKNSKSSYANRT